MTTEGSPRVSIKDIARAAGVSHSTVSRALRDSPLLKRQTVDRIQGLAREMGYSPDARARGLVSGQSSTVGVVVTTIADPFIAEVVHGIESTAAANDYSVILASSNSDAEREIAAVSMLRSKRVDAVVVTSSRVGALYAQDLERFGVPIVLLNNHSEAQGPYTFSVRVDDRHGGWLATRHLIELGHRRIAYIAGDDDNSTSAHRLAGYLDALAEAGIPRDRSLLVPGTGRAAAGEGALSALTSVAERPTAVFCYNDMTAVGVLRAASESGLEVPSMLSVVGFDDIPIASYVSPPLTTVAQPKFELGQRAMEMALALMANSDGARQVNDIVLRGTLVVRKSTTQAKDSH